jgi:hypothetical protein
MIKWLTEYQEEAANCDAIVLATILNPRSRVKFFELHYPEHEATAQALIEHAFDCLVEETKVYESTPAPEETNVPLDPDEFDVFGSANGSPAQAANTELQEYLQGQFPIRRDQTPLKWWKVRPFTLVSISSRH